MFGIYDILREYGKHSPDKTAVICDEGRYTFRQLNERINSVAHGLSEQGIKKGTPVGLIFYNGIDFITSFYALVKLGACVSPFNYRYKVGEVEQLQNIVNCKYFIIGSEFIPILEELRRRLQPVTDIKVIFSKRNKCAPSLEEFIKNGNCYWDFTEQLSPEDEILTIFTGGTTGLPKAAAHSQQSTFLTVMGYLLEPDAVNCNDVALNYAPLFHIGGLFTMLKILSAGATFYLLSSFDSERIIKVITEERVTQMALIPPTIIDRFREARGRNDIDLSSLRLLLMAGGYSDEATAEKAFELMPDVLFMNAYGHSENAIHFSNVFNREQYYADKSIIGSVGIPQALYEAKIVKDDGTEAACGECGEVYGRSVAMMAGYKGRTDSFTPDGWFATGDVMRRDANGNYYFLSRSKDMIKSGGENIYASEVENAITLDSDGVAECAVIGLPDREWGEIVTAAVVLRPGVQMTEDDVINHCKTTIASYKKPKKVFFLPELPLSGVGKVQKYVLREMLMQM